MAPRKTAKKTVAKKAPTEKEAVAVIAKAIVKKAAPKRKYVRKAPVQEITAEMQQLAHEVSQKVVAAAIVEMEKPQTPKKEKTPAKKAVKASPAKKKSPAKKVVKASPADKTGMIKNPATGNWIKDTAANRKRFLK